jgi:hypothetical protein
MANSTRALPERQVEREQHRLHDYADRVA